MAILLVVLSLLSSSSGEVLKGQIPTATAFLGPKTKTTTKIVTNRQLLFGGASSITTLPSFHARYYHDRKTISSYFNTKLFFFWQNNNNDDDKNSDLLKIDNVSGTYDGVSTFLKEWSKTYEGDGAKSNGLTTPVSVVPSLGENSSDDEDIVVLSQSGVKLIFLPTKTGDAYKSKDEEKNEESSSPKKKKKEDKPKKEGGVEIVVEKISSDGDEKLRVRAFRCELDEDTMIKEMSEETIIKNLKKAMDAWKKQQSA